MSDYYYDDEPVSPHQRPHRRRRPARTALLVLVSIVLVAAIAVGGYLFSLASVFNSKSQTIEAAFPEGDRPPAAPGDNILLLGSDEGADTEEQIASGAPRDTRADTMMLVHIPKDRSQIFVMSIMRDTWTEIPGVGEGKMNSAMSIGGIPLVVQTIEAMFDSRIDHVAMIDFEGFKGLTDALGGVEVDNPGAFQSRGSKGEYFAEGPITLSGDQALKFVRERYAFGDGDYQRVKNQQVFVKALMGEVLTPQTLANPVKLYQLVDETAPYLSVDKEFGASTAGGLAFGLRGARTSDVRFFTLPNLGVGTSFDGQSIVVKDDAAIGEISGALADDSLGQYLDSSDIEN